MGDNDAETEGSLKRNVGNAKRFTITLGAADGIYKDKKVVCKRI
jgi:hypothetical protein